MGGGERRIEEDSHLFLPEAIRASTPKMGFKQRCHYYSQEELRKQTFWEPDLIYNFDFLSSRVDFNDFNVVLGPFRKGMAPYMNKQPFDFRAVVCDDANKIIGHLFAIEFMLDSMFEGEVPDDEDAAPAKGMESLEIDPEKTAAEYDEHLGLSQKQATQNLALRLNRRLPLPLRHLTQHLPYPQPQLQHQLRPHRQTQPPRRRRSDAIATFQRGSLILARNTSTHPVNYKCIGHWFLEFLPYR